MRNLLRAAHQTHILGAANFSFGNNFVGIWTPAKVPPDAATDKPAKTILFFLWCDRQWGGRFLLSLWQRGWCLGQGGEVDNPPWLWSQLCSGNRRLWELALKTHKMDQETYGWLVRQLTLENRQLFQDLFLGTWSWSLCQHWGCLNEPNK